MDDARRRLKRISARPPVTPRSPVAETGASAPPVRPERRRSRRRRLRQPTEVRLLSPDSDGAARFRGPLLNVSRHGLACRLRDEDAATLAPGQTLRLVFRLSNCAAPFEFVGQVINVTPGGTPHCSVVGLEFKQAPELKPRQARLQEVLNSELETTR